MFTAYFDAAGTSRDRVMSIGGFVSDIKKWKRFETEWKKILDRESVTCFHMTDFVSSEREFKEWKGQSDRRRKFIADLVACARRNTNKAFGGALLVRDYDAVNKKYQLQENAGYPYSLCGHFCTYLVRKWQRKNDVKNVLFMFEKGDQHQGDLDRLCAADDINPSYPTKVDATPCQAADLLAWRTRYGFDEALKPSSLDVEKAQRLNASFSEVWGRIPHQAFYGNRQSLEKLCIERGIPKR
jgi:hypothetical protein